MLIAVKVFFYLKTREDRNGYSRFPVCGDDADDAVGILNAKKYLTAAGRGEAKAIDEYLLPVRFVHESMRINGILIDMQREHAHMVIVVDDFSGVTGVITLEDILRSLSARSGMKVTRSLRKYRNRQRGGYGQ